MIDETLLEAMDKMDKAVEHTQTQFATVRTGRATPSLVERITIDYYGAQVPLQQIASISVPEARQRPSRPSQPAAWAIPRTSSSGKLSKNSVK